MIDHDRFGAQHSQRTLSPPIRTAPLTRYYCGRANQRVIGRLRRPLWLETAPGPNGNPYGSYTLQAVPGRPALACLDAVRSSPVGAAGPPPSGTRAHRGRLGSPDRSLETPRRAQKDGRPLSFRRGQLRGASDMCRAQPGTQRRTRRRVTPCVYRTADLRKWQAVSTERREGEERRPEVPRYKVLREVRTLYFETLARPELTHIGYIYGPWI